MWRGKVKEKVLARTMRQSGRSVKDIARQLGVAKSSVSMWVRSVQLTAKQRKHLQIRELQGGAKGQRTMKRYWAEYHKLHPKPAPKGPRWPKRDVENFFDTWTPEMAYVLGYFAADGCMYRNKRGSCYTSFTSTDRELIETVRNLMGVQNRIEEYQRPKPNCKRRFVLQIGSKKLYSRLIELGFTPNKSLVIRFPSVPPALLYHFVRGYFDGDGCVFFGQYTRSGKPGKIKRVLQVTFVSGSRDFVVSLRRNLAQLIGLGMGAFRSRIGGYDVSYSARDARQLYEFMYPTSTVHCLTRKRAIFEQAFKILDP